MVAAIRRTSTVISRLMLTNYSAPRKQYQAELEITLGPEISIAEGKKLLFDAAVSKSPTEVLTPAQKPLVRAAAYAAEGVTYTIKYWVPQFSDDEDCRDAILMAIDDAIRKQGLPPPFRRIKIMTVKNEPESPEDPIQP